MMCYFADKKSDFHWRDINDESDLCIDHTYLVSDGENIGLAGCSIDGSTGKFEWHYLFDHSFIEVTSYYGGQFPGKPDFIDIEDIKFWCPIPNPRKL